MYVKPYHYYYLHRADYTHVIFIGTNELSRVVQALSRYALGAALVGPNYQDPVDFDRVFEVCTRVECCGSVHCRFNTRPWLLFNILVCMCIL